MYGVEGTKVEGEIPETFILYHEKQKRKSIKPYEFKLGLNWPEYGVTVERICYSKAALSNRTSEDDGNVL